MIELWKSSSMNQLTCGDFVFIVVGAGSFMTWFHWWEALFLKDISFKFLCLHRPSISHLLFFKRFILIWKSPSVRNLHSRIFMNWQFDLIMFILLSEQSILCPLLFFLAKANCGLLFFYSRLLWSCFLERLYRNGFRSIPINRWMY